MREFMESCTFQQVFAGSLRRIWAKVYRAEDRPIILIPAACRRVSLSALGIDAGFRAIGRHNDGKVCVLQAGTLRRGGTACANAVRIALLACSEAIQPRGRNDVSSARGR